MDCEMGEVRVLHKDDFFAEGEEVYIQIDRDGSDFGGIMHRHDFIEITYVISGKARHFMGYENYEVHRGDIVVINYGEPHTFIPMEGEEDFSTYDLLFTTDFFEIGEGASHDIRSLASSYLFYSLFDDTNRYGSLRLIRPRTDEISAIFHKIHEEYTTKEKGYLTLIRAYLIELITKIFREIDYANRGNVTSEQKEIVNKAIAFMQENYNTHIDVGKIASGVFFSKDYFRQFFKKTTGMSITDFFQNTRIEKAKELLENTDRPIYAIAGECGYTHMTYFYNTFKKKVGVSPGEYRKQKKKEEEET